MNSGDILLARLPQADGREKLRPVLALQSILPYADWLVMGISSRLAVGIQGQDEWIQSTEADFSSTGLKASSVIRVGFLATLPRSQLLGRIGFISPSRLDSVRQKLLRLISVVPPQD